MPEETPSESAQGDEKTGTASEVKPPSPDADAERSEDSLPEWARKELVKTRNEAAGYRTRLRDAEVKLSEAKSPEEFEAALSEVKLQNAALERSLLVTRVAGKFELPEILADALKGDTPEELEAHAKALRAIVAPPHSPTLSGGLNPVDEGDGEMDPRKLARRTRRF
ncbi:hypothetical protein [Streptomyces sp. NPDC057552]|uniref:hypothetical protein n=1 Tax=Streptomyces sp. NPDC057552 TaxID=3350537 RepID=UPI0036C8ACD9